jgi:hypothetical protein
VIDSSSFLGIPYRYGGSDRTGCDCAGIAALVYAEVYGIHIDADFFYRHCPTHEQSSIRPAIRVLKSQGFTRVRSLNPGVLLLGYSPDSFGFGLWTGKEVLCCTRHIGSHLKNWEEWKSSQQVTTLWKHPKL